MSLFGAFLSHEATTQLRSARFRITAIAYAALAFAPAVAVAIVASRNDFIAGPATFAAAITLFQPMLTTLLSDPFVVELPALLSDGGSRQGLVEAKTALRAAVREALPVRAAPAGVQARERDRVAGVDGQNRLEVP